MSTRSMEDRVPHWGRHPVALLRPAPARCCRNAAAAVYMDKERLLKDITASEVATAELEGGYAARASVHGKVFRVSLRS